VGLQWLSNFPGFIDPKRKAALLDGIQQTFGVSEAEVWADIAGMELPPAPSRNGHEDPERVLEASLPQDGWLHDYAEYARFVEIPLAYSLCCGLVVLGTALGRRVYVQEGHFNVYPNLSTLLIGPPARLHKSTAVNMAKKLVISANLAPIFPDKITPEALITELTESGPLQFIGASELSMFFGKQKYNEGLIPVFLKMLDTEDVPVKVKSIARSTEYLEGVTLCMIGGSTMTLLTDSSAKEVTGSGFLSRFLPIVEEETQRCFPFPMRSEAIHENRLMLTLERMKSMSGEVSFEPKAHQWYDGWYRERWKQHQSITEDDLLQCMGRGAVHLKKIATLIHLADHKDFQICIRCLEAANTLLAYSEARLPRIIKAVNTNQRSEETECVLSQLRKNGGAMDHSRLLRSLSSKGIDAARLKALLDTLKQSQEIRETQKGNLRFYVLEAQ
jgi:hypothetical protein